MLKLIIVFFIFLYSTDSVIEKDVFTTKWGSQERYCENFICNVTEDDFDVVDVFCEGHDRLYVYVADKKLISLYKNNEFNDIAIGIVESE